MKKKHIVIILVLAVMVVAVGVSYAAWGISDMKKEHTYTVDANTYNYVEITQTAGQGKLTPASDSAVASVVDNLFSLKVLNHACDISFSIINIQYKEGEAWLDLPNGILNIKLMKGDVEITSDNNILGVHEYKTQVALIPNMDVIDPIYKNTTFKFTVYADVTRSV